MGLLHILIACSIQNGYFKQLKTRDGEGLGTRAVSLALTCISGRGCAVLWPHPSASPGTVPLRSLPLLDPASPSPLLSPCSARGGERGEGRGGKGEERGGGGGGEGEERGGGGEGEERGGEGEERGGEGEGRRGEGRGRGGEGRGGGGEERGGEGGGTENKSLADYQCSC